jgi:ribosome-binding factor A
MRRQKKIQSLLLEVLSEVIRKDVKDPRISELLTLMSVEVSSDLQNAKVGISVIGDEKAKQQTLDALNEQAPRISAISLKKVALRYFPKLSFHIDTGLEHELRIHDVLTQIKDERNSRGQIADDIEDSTEI